MIELDIKPLLTEPVENSIPLTIINHDIFNDWLSTQPIKVVNSFASHNINGFTQNAVIPIMKSEGEIKDIYVLVDNNANNYLEQWSKVVAKLPSEYTFHIKNIEILSDKDIYFICLAFYLTTYDFDVYKSRNVAELQKEKEYPKFIVPTQQQAIINDVTSEAKAIFLLRDLINTPANYQSPKDLAVMGKEVFSQYGAEIKIHEGDEVVRNWPAVYAVGQGSAPDRQPVVLEATWGNPRYPRVAIVGKGIVFDTGGNNLKGDVSMRLMKKDMGGAAHAIALAQLIMQVNLPLHLHIIIPMSENSNSAGAMRPSDVYTTKSGHTIEIGNTDAEGRVILCDALFEADAHKPELIIDFATLTGAKAVALGSSISALFCNKPEFTQKLMYIVNKTEDYLWPLPLFANYTPTLNTKFADLSTTSDMGNGGSITAALFLQQFIQLNKSPWIHLDVHGWSYDDSPLYPVGGKESGLRAIYYLLRETFTNISKHSFVSMDEGQHQNAKTSYHL